MSSALTESIDVAQVVLYVFWAFFFGLIFWLRREDRREGYPLESDKTRRLTAITPAFIPPPKTFLLPHGGSVQAPRFDRDTRALLAQPTSDASGAPLQPTGEPLLAGVGPSAFAPRADTPELTREGHDLIVPMRVASDFAVNAGPDPRGWKVVAADGKVAGVIKDLWVDRADIMVRYLEVELASADAGTRLLPITMLRLMREPRRVEVFAVRAEHFAHVPTLKDADRITLLEEERICAFYAGGRLYAEPKRLGPVL
ncbi:MAG TPA: photosynthetic reaction center subunit H [Pseudomonadota bacterium]|nr:photosynthetic reaction center subunit H [Pseudomonadota bacterium]